MQMTASNTSMAAGTISWGFSGDVISAVIMQELLLHRHRKVYCFLSNLNNNKKLSSKMPLESQILLPGKRVIHIH